MHFLRFCASSTRSRGRGPRGMRRPSWSAQLAATLTNLKRVQVCRRRLPGGVWHIIPAQKRQWKSRIPTDTTCDVQWTLRTSKQLRIIFVNIPCKLPSYIPRHVCVYIFCPSVPSAGLLAVSLSIPLPWTWPFACIATASS